MLDSSIGVYFGSTFTDLPGNIFFLLPFLFLYKIKPVNNFVKLMGKLRIQSAERVIDLFFTFFHLLDDVVLHAVDVFKEEAIDEVYLGRRLIASLDSF